MLCRSGRRLSSVAREALAPHGLKLERGFFSLTFRFARNHGERDCDRQTAIAISARISYLLTVSEHPVDLCCGVKPRNKLARKRDHDMKKSQPLS